MRLRVRATMAKYLLLDGAAIVRTRALNPLRLLLGRERQQRDGRCLKILAGHFFGARKIAFVARGPTPTDGAGFQVFLTMATISFCELIGAKYVHVPFSAIKHADRPMDSYAQAWNDAFRPEIEPGASPGDPDRAVQFIELYNHANFIKVFRPLLYDGLAAHRDAFKRVYRHPVRTPDSGARTIRVAVHFRQGDVGPGLNDFMWIDPAAVSASIEQVRLILEGLGLKPQLILVSQDRSPLLEALGCDFDLELVGADTLQSFAALSSADVIVMAKSYFSYCAAYFSNAVCLFRPWGNLLHPDFPVPEPLDEWICSRPDGGFDQAAFRRELHRKGLVPAPAAAKS